MDVFRLLKFLHLAAVALWVGGAFTVAVLVWRLRRASDRSALASVLAHAGFYGRAVVGPASLVTLLTGVGMLAWLGIAPEALWVRWGFAGILGHFVLGATLLRRATLRLQALANAGESQEDLAAAVHRVGVLNALYLSLLLSVVGAMALKPTL